MALEKTLAEIQVLAHELIMHDYFSSTEQNFITGITTITGVKKDSELVYKKCMEADHALKKQDFSSASSFFTEMALDAKNLAENLSIFVQNIYGDVRPTLKNLKVNTLRAPIATSGKTIYEIFMNAHDSRENSLIKLARDSKGHGMGHAILGETPRQDHEYFKNTPYVAIFKDLRSNSTSPVLFLPRDFVYSSAQAYLEMTKTILQTIADKDTEHFGERKTNRKYKITKQRAKNFYQRHSKPIAMILGSTLLTAGLIGGSLGTIAYQNYAKQQEMQNDVRRMSHVIDFEEGFEIHGDNWKRIGAQQFKKELIEERKLKTQQAILAYPPIASTYDLEKVFGTESNLYEQAVNDLQVKSIKRGTYVDNYLLRASINPADVNGMAKEFLLKREDFRERVKKFSSLSKVKIPTVDLIETLDDLVKEEQSLGKMEDQITSFFPRLR
jgi:hypothetical protein